MASSKTRHSAGSTPNRLAANRYISGAGLPLLSSGSSQHVMLVIYCNMFSCLECISIDWWGEIKRGQPKLPKSRQHLRKMHTEIPTLSFSCQQLPFDWRLRLPWANQPEQTEKRLRSLLYMQQFLRKSYSNYSPIFCRILPCHMKHGSTARVSE